MNNRALLVIFVFLAMLYGLFRLFSAGNERAFQAELIRVDTATVTSIVITLKGQTGEELTLQRENNGWIATDGVRSIKTLNGPINTLLSHLGLINTQYLASNDPGRWQELEVSEDNGTRIRIYQGQKVIEDFIIGRFSVDPQKRAGVSFVRLSGQNEVYAIDGFQALSFCQDFDAYRNRTLIDIADETAIDEIEFQRTDTSFRLIRSGRQWLLNGATPVDSIAIDRFILSLRHLSGETFADDFDELRLDRTGRQALILHSKMIPEPLVIEIFRDSSRLLPFIIHSNQFPENFFASDSSGLFRRLQLPF